MSSTAEVEGRLAILNYPTTDGRVLEVLPGKEAFHFGLLPVPVIVQSADRSDVIGMISHIRLDQRQNLAGMDLFGFGEIDLSALITLRPDLAPPPILRADDPPKLLRADIYVHRVEFREEGGRHIAGGPWELRSVTIPREDLEPVWPGTGLRFTKFPLEAVRG